MLLLLQLTDSGELSSDTRYNPIINTCYQVGGSKTWYEAKRDCEAREGFLFIPETQDLVNWFNSEFHPTHQGKFALMKKEGRLYWLF